MKNNDYRDYCFKNTDKEECVEYLIQSNMGLVYSKVNDYFANGSFNSDDLIQEGTIGLWKAIKTYDQLVLIMKYVCYYVNNKNTINSIVLVYHIYYMKMEMGEHYV